MKKQISLVLVILCMLLLLISCDFKSDNNITSPPDNSTEDTSVMLSDFEDKIYSILIKHISTFNDPSSVKLISYNKNFYEEKILILRISATNKLGATVTNDYVMVIDDFKVYDAYDYLDYYEMGHLHMPAMEPTMEIPKGTLYSFEPWGDPYETENNDIPHEYFVLYQIANYAIPEETSTTVNIANINKRLNTYKVEMGW